MGVGRILRAQPPPVHGKTVPGYNTVSGDAESITLSRIPQTRKVWATLTIELRSRSRIHWVRLSGSIDI